jgi:PilX N-terminal
MEAKRKLGGVPKLQSGAALVVALLILIVITALSLAAMRSSTMQLQMASNDEHRMDAFQTAQAAIDYVISIRTDPVSPENYFPVIGGAGYALCTACPGSGYPCFPRLPENQSCTVSTVSLPAPPFSDYSQVQVLRLPPDLRPPPRGTETSIEKFDAATFQVDSVYDQSAAGRGKAELVQGYIILVPKMS